MRKKNRKKNYVEIVDDIAVVVVVVVSLTTVTLNGVKVSLLRMPAAPIPRPKPKAIPTRTIPAIVPTIIHKVLPPSASVLVLTGGDNAYGFNCT